MYISVRDFVVREVAKALGNENRLAKTLKYLGVNAIELEYFSDGRYYLLEPEEGQDNRGLIKKERCELLRTQLLRHGIRISAFLMHNNFGDTNMTRQIEWIIRCIEAAEYFKVKAVRIDPIIKTDRDVSIEEAAHMSAKALREVFSQISMDKKVSLAIENHGKYGNNPEFLRKVIANVNDDRLGLTLDSGNFYWYGFSLEEVYNIFEEFAPLVRHTHLKNIKYPDEIKSKRRDIGYKYEKYVYPIYGGDIDHSRFVEILKKVGYEEDLCIEDESLGKYSPEEVLDIMKKDVEYLKGLIVKYQDNDDS